MSLTSNNLQFRAVINQVVNDPAYKEVSSVPLISMHQLALIGMAYLGVFGGMALYVYEMLSLWVVYPIMIFSFYTAFTPLHDATHRAISSNKLLNDLLGTISGFILFPMSNAIGYRYLHLSHHRYVGDEDLDPDETMVSLPTTYYPFGYIALFFPDLLWSYWLLFKAWKRTPTYTRLNVLTMIVGNVLFHSLWLWSPFAYEYLILFFIPNRLGIAYTTYTFAHSPHPEGVKWHEHPFQTTYQLIGNQFFLMSFFNQNHHAMHHFLPHIPWYKYHQIWDLANGTFRKQGIPEKEIFSKPDFHFKEHLLLEKRKDSDLELLAEVTQIVEVAKNIKSFTFKPIDDTIDFPAFSSGAHITVFLPSGKQRSYSCVNPSYEKNCYQIAVKMEPAGKGGSKELFEQVSVGDHLKISKPQNNFVLYENVQKYILIAGGIGITPLLSMAHRLTEIDKHFELHICAQSMEDIPFQYELQNWTFATNVDLHVDKLGKSTLELNKVLSSPNKDTLVYICGPSGFNQWIKDAALSLGWKKEQIKQESFTRSNATLLETKAFQLVLQKRNQVITVKKDETIIDALHQHNINVPYSCLQGTCGTCIGQVLEGQIDHRDAVLSQEEKLAQKKICLCVSRAKGDQLVLDL